MDELEPELFHQTEIALGADIVAGDHRFDIEADILGIAAHAGQGLKYVLAKLVFLDDLETGNANAFVKNFVRATAEQTAGIRRVRAGRRPGD